MRLSLTWLQDFITFTENNPQTIADAITVHTAEVDEVEVLGGLLEHCCVGKVLSLEMHPNADRLSLCDVQTDKGKKRVVCGGTNLRVGMRVAFAHIGATVLWHGEELATLEPVKIRGEASEGMICAAVELGLEKLFPVADDRLIIDLGDGDDGVGKPLKEYLGMDDVILHIDNHAITQRPDLFSHIGFARECVAMRIAKWKSGFLPSSRDPNISFAKQALPFKIHVEDKKLVSRYACCVLEFDALGETPDFMKARLAAADWRSINLPVDITNFVSSEIGMPLHSFDADDIKGNVSMRAAKKGEKITTLDGVERELPAGALVMSDDEGIFDLLGIMGGLRSSTTEKTRRIFLHSAAVDPVCIRRTILATGHRTEAATVYEKGIAPVAVEQGFYRALELFLKYVPGARIVSVMESWGDDGKAPTITLSADRARSLIGEDIPTGKMVQILEDLECIVAVKGNVLTVLPPLHRLRDLRESHDLIEEIARMYGYNDIEPQLPHASTATPARDFRTQHLRRALQLRKHIECLPLSLVGPELLKKCGFDADDVAVIRNPIGEELSMVQPSLLPQLLVHAGENILRVDTVLRTFSLGTVFTAKADKCTELCVIHAVRGTVDAKQEPLLTLKRDVCSALESIGYTCTVKPAKKHLQAANSARALDLYVQEKLVGSLFEVLPSVREAFDLHGRTAAAIIDWSAVLALLPVTIAAKALPQFPAVMYDETITIDPTKHMQTSIEKMQKVSALLTSLETVDLYKNKLTLRFTYRAADRTLKEEEAKKEHEKVLQCVNETMKQ